MPSITDHPGACCDQPLAAGQTDVAAAGGQDDPAGQIPVLQVQGAAPFGGSLENITSRPAAATYLDETPCILYNQYFNSIDGSTIVV